LEAKYCHEQEKKFCYQRRTESRKTRVFTANQQTRISDLLAHFLLVNVGGRKIRSIRDSNTGLEICANDEDSLKVLMIVGYV